MRQAQPPGGYAAQVYRRLRFGLLAALQRIACWSSPLQRVKEERLLLCSADMDALGKYAKT